MYEGRIKWIEHKGKRILYLDYSSLKNEELQEMFGEVNKTLMKEPINSVRYLTDTTGMNFSVKTISLFNKQAEATKNWDKCSAVLGVTGLVKVMYDGYSKISTIPLKTFNDKNIALDWLASI